MAQSAGRIPSAKQYLENLTDKMNDPVFCSDIRPLLRPGIQYDIRVAYEAFRKHFIEAM
jgi:hypothetical protein